MFNHRVLTNYGKTGSGQQVAQFPWLSSDFQDVGTSAVGFALGSSWFDVFGNEFKLKFNTAATALNFGDLLIWETVAADADTVNAAPAPTVRIFGLAAGFGGVAGALKGGWVYNAVKGASGVTLTTGQDSLKPIKDNTATGAGQLITVSVLDTKVSNLQNDADAYNAVPVAAQAVTMIAPYRVTVFPTAANTVSHAVGVSTGAVVASHYTFTQVGGLALVAATGGGTALVKGAACVPSGVTAGNVIGAAAPAANSPGICCAAYTAAVGGVAPIWLTLIHS